MRNAPTVTIIVLQGNQGSYAAEDETSHYERIRSVNDASGIQATTGATEAAPTNFLVHENLICEASPVLKAAFQGNFAEGGSKIMTVRDLDADAVHHFLQWLYRGRKLPTKPGTKDAERIWYLQMAGLVVVADIWRVENLEDDVIDMLVRTGDDLLEPPYQAVGFVYANTCHLSYLRRWLVAWYTEGIELEWYKHQDARRFMAKFPDFGNDIAMAFGKQLTHPRPKSFFNMTREERKAPVDLVLDSDSE